MNSRQTFNPNAPCVMHDQLNNELIQWNVECAADYREFAQSFFISWDGMLLDGWFPHLTRSAKFDLSAEYDAQYLPARSRLPSRSKIVSC